MKYLGQSNWLVRPQSIRGVRLLVSKAYANGTADAALKKFMNRAVAMIKDDLDSRIRRVAEEIEKLLSSKKTR